MFYPAGFNFTKKRNTLLSKQDLIDFENSVKEKYEEGKIKGPIHLSGNNEDQLIELFQYIEKEDWVFSTWRNHYHALLHGVSAEKLFSWICEGRSMSINNLNPNFYTSSIVGGILPIALGVALSLKLKKSDKKVWCFIGDMTFETGVFHEVHKYSKAFNLPINFVVEDNNMSTNTPTDEVWGSKENYVDDKIIYYQYKRDYPHHGTGTWISF